MRTTAQSYVPLIQFFNLSLHFNILDYVSFFILTNYLKKTEKCLKTILFYFIIIIFFVLLIQYNIGCSLSHDFFKIHVSPSLIFSLNSLFCGYTFSPSSLFFFMGTIQHQLLTFVFKR